MSPLKLAFALFIIFASSAEAHEVLTLCSQSETVVFSCSAKKKMLSVCIADNQEFKQPMLIYRFGSFGKIELTYPSNAKGQFFVSHLNSTKSREDRLRFSSGAYSYLVYSFTHSQEGNKSGIVVSDTAGKLIANVKCSSSDDSEPWPINLPPSLAQTEKFDLHYDLP